MRTYWFEAAVLGGAVSAALEIVFKRNGADAPELDTWAAAPLAAVIVLTLFLRRKRPFAAPAGLWIAAPAISFIDGSLVTGAVSVYVAGLASAFLLGNLTNVQQSRVGLGLVLLGMVIIVYNAPDADGGSYVFLPALFGMAWLIGLVMQQRGARAEAAEERATRLLRDREQATHAAIADERSRIARELHDVLGHSVSVMTIQASAVRRLLKPEQEQEREALLAVEQTGREALAEMRRLVGILRLDEGEPDLQPQPGLGELPKLIAQAGELGLDVALRVEGEAVSLPPGVDLTAYRLVQEGLTNVRKHSTASHTEVRLRYDAGAIEVEVLDNGRQVQPAEDGGHGLVGMRERVNIYGGEFEAGPTEGGFRLRARLPVTS